MADKCVIFLALIAGTLAGPLSYRENPSSCASTCPESSKFSWQIGKTYEYQYESDVKTTIAGAMEEHSSLHIRATALIEVLAPCEMALRLSDVSLQDSSPSQYESRQHVDQTWEFKKSLQERALRFAFLDGRIESVCPEEGDETWVINLKKGIISAFQNTQSRLDAGMVTVESDVTGNCPVEYEVEGSSWGTKTIKKTKDLLGCTERMGHFTAFQSTPYSVDSAIQSLPLLKSTHECRQQIKNGILTESTCTELHVFRAFSRDNNGAATEVTYKLVLYKENAGVSTSQGRVVSRSSLLFEHEPNDEELVSSLREAQQSLEKLCRKSEDEIGTEVPRLFKELVHQMRRLDSRSLQGFHRSAGGTCDKATKFIRDAIPVLGTPSSVTLIRDLIMADQVSDTDAKIWLTSLAFIGNPTRDMLREVKPLLTSSHHLRKSILAISTMVHSYCRQNTECTLDPEVGDIIRVLEDNLRYNCKAQSDEQHDLILMSLKALGNTGHATQTAPTVNRCFRNQELPVEIRVAALQAFRRMACEAEMTNVKDLMENTLEDSELRIQAYLTLMQCPSADTLTDLARMLEKEQVNQVGSFVWTHLTNLMETSNPHKRDVREILENVKLQKKFDLDKRKFSRNMEWSAFSQLLNVGGVAEGNLIWSEKSFIPRSAALNLTVELFGESVNLLEIGARVQGLEKMLETLFAEQDNSVERRKRSTDEISTLHRRFDGKRDSTQASYYIRVFGNEIRYDDFHDFDLDTIKDKLNYLDWLIELSQEHKFDLTKTMMFLDATITVPTAAGLPLRLNVDGVSSVSVSVSGKLDIRQMFSSLSTFDIDGFIKPSASVEITGEMGVDAHLARTGIKVKTTVHTSTAAEGKIQMQNGRIFNLDVKPPKDNTQVISAEKKFYVIYRDQEREQTMLSGKTMERKRCTSAKFSTITGVELCGELSLPSPDDKDNVPWFVLWGPASAKVYINKKDSHDRYLMELKYVKEKTRQNGVNAITDTARIYMDTPGSRINRKLLVDFKMDRNGKTVDFNLDTPWKKTTVQSGLTNTDELKRFYSTVTVDGKDEYSINAEVAIDKRSYSSQYVPKVEVRIPGRERIILNGDVKYRPGKKAVFTMILRNVFDQPIKASGTVATINEPNHTKYETELDFSSHLLEGKLAAFVDKTKEMTKTYSSKLDVSYKYRDQPEQAIKFEERFVDGSASSSMSYTLDSSWSTTLIPRYNGDVHFDYNMNKESLSTNLNAGFDQTRRITYTETARYAFTAEKKFDLNTRLQFPYKNIDYSGKFGYLATSDQLKITGSAKYDTDKESAFEMMARRQSKKPLKLVADAKLTYPGQEMAISGSVQERASGVYHQTLNIQIPKYDHIQVNSVYKMEPRHELTSEIKIKDATKLTIKGHLNPDLKHVQAHGEVTYSGKTYMTDVNWQHQGRGANFNTRADAQVGYPGRLVKVEGSLSRQNSEIAGSVETKWDASRDERKSFALSSKVNIEPTSPAAELKINIYPSHYVNVNLNGKYETGGWYKTSSDVEGSFSLQSSFENLEDLRASFVHDRTPKLYKNRAEISWDNNNKKIAASMDLKKKMKDWASTEISVEINTPFKGARTIGTNLDYSLLDTSFSTNMKASLENKQITLDLKGELDVDRHELSGELQFTSPFPDLEAITASVHHSDDGQKYRSNAAVSWAPSKQITATFNLQHQGDMNAALQNGKLAITTPFSGYQEMKASWKHEHNSNKLVNVADLEQEGKSIYNHNLITNLRRTRASYAVDMQATMKAANLDEVSFTLDHYHDRKQMKKFRSDYSLSWKPRKTITVSYDVEMSGDNLLSASAQFTSPFKGFEDLALKSDTAKNGPSYTNNNEFKWANKKKLTLTSEVTINGYEVQLTGRMSTPFDELKSIVVNGKNEQQDGIWLTHLDLDYGKKIKLDTELSTGYRKLVSVRLQSACPYVHNLFFKSEMTGQPRDFQYDVEINHEKLSTGITWSGVVKTADVNRIKITSDLATPFREVTSLKLVTNYIKEGNSVHVDGMIQHPRYTGKITEDLSYQPGRSVNSNTVVEYMKGEKIELDADITVKPQMNAKISWKSPFKNLEKVDAILNHEGSLRTFTTSGELSYGSNEKIAANVNFDLKGDVLSSRAMLTTPFRKAKRLVLVVNHQGPLTDFTNEASLEVNRKRLSEKSEFSWKGDAMNLKTEILTPFSGYETMTLELRHEGSLANFNNNVMLTYGNQQLSGSSEFRLRRAALTGNLALQLPFRKLSSVGLNVLHTGRWSDFNNKVVLSYNNKKLISKTNFVKDGSDLEGKIAIKTPFSDVKSLGVGLKHEGPINNFKNAAVFSLNDKEFRANSEFTLAGNNMSLKASVASPSTKIKSIKLDVTHEGPAHSFNNKAALTYNNKQIEASSQFSLQGPAVNGKVDFRMPKHDLAAEFSHSGSARDFRNNALFSYNEKSISARTQLKLTGNNLRTKANFASPWVTLAGELNHDGPINHFTNNAVFGYNGKEATVASEFNIDGNAVSARGNLNAPKHKLTVDFNHNGPLGNFNNEMMVKYNGESYRGASNFARTGDSVTGKLEFTSPKNTMSGEVNHRGTRTNFNNDLELVYGNKRAVGNSKFSLAGNTLTAEANLEMPDRRYSLVASHGGPLTDFKNSLNVQYDGSEIRGSSEFRMSRGSVALKASLETPYKSIRSASIDFSHRGSLSHFNNNVVIVLNDKELVGSSLFRLEDDRVIAKATLLGPGVNFTAELSHNGKPTSFKNDAKLAYNGRQLAGNSVFRLGDGSLSLKGELATPSNRMSADISHNGAWRNFRNNGVLSLNGRRMAASSAFSHDGRSTNGKATVTVASKKLDVEFNHNGRPTDFASDVSAEYDGTRVSGNVQFALQRNRLNAKAELSLPIQSVRTISVEVSHNGPPNDFKNTAKVIVGTDSITAGSEFSLQGNELTAKANLATTYGLEPMSVTIEHSGPETSFTNSAVFSYGRKQFSANSEFNLQGNDLTLKANAQTSFRWMDPISIRIEHNGPKDRFTCRGTAKYGKYEISVNNDFNMARNTVHLKTSMRTNIPGVKSASVELNHEGTLKNFNNDAMVSYGDDNISGTSEFELEDNAVHLKATAQTTLGKLKPITLEVNHNGTGKKFQTDAALSYGNKEFSSQVKLAVEGNTITGDLKLQTPYKQVEKVIGKFSHSGKHWRNFENNAALKVNNKKYTGQSELRWFGKIFKLYAKVNVPDEYSVKVNHKGYAKDFSNNMKVKIPGEKISGTSSFKMDGDKTEGRVNLDSTIRSLDDWDMAFSHEGDSRKFKSSFDLQTPFRSYKSFSGKLEHEGSPQDFKTTGTLDLPFKEVRNVVASANHQYDGSSLASAASLTYDNKAIAGNVNYRRSNRKIIADATINTPYSRYENFGVSMEHAGTPENFQTSGAITTSIPGYERFSGTVNHRGDIDQFSSTAEINTPIAKYNKFGVSVEKTGNNNNFKAKGTLTSSVPGYEMFGGDVDYSYDGSNLHAAANVQTPFRSYEKFGMKADHEKSFNGYRTSLEATSSVPGYERFGTTIQNKQVGRGFEVSSTVRTPFRNYEQLGAELRYSRRPMGFNTTGHVTTSIPGYERFSGSLSHHGDSKVFSTEAEIQTPVRGHEVYKMAVDHNANQGISTVATLEYPGKRYSFNLNHRGTPTNFNSDLQIQTPHRGYEQFGVTVAHSGSLRDMTQSGTIRLPLSKLGDIKYSITNRGQLSDFTTSVVIEYKREKIEANWNCKCKQTFDGGDFEGGLRISSTLPSIRDIQITANHKRGSRQKSGMLDVIQNGEKTVDIDYDYTTSGELVVNVRVRQPQPLETRIDFNGDGEQYTGNAYLNWKKTTLSGDFNIKNLPNDRQINAKLVLPSRTLALNAGYTRTEGGLKHNAELQWGNKDSNKLSYLVEGSRTVRRARVIVDGRLNVQSSAISGEATINHVAVPGRQYTTELAVQTKTRMAIKSELALNDNRFEHTITVEHPELKRGASVKTEGSFMDGAYDGKIELHYNKETFTLTGRLADESRYSNKKYSSSVQLTHANTGLDLQMSGSVEHNSEITSVLAETRYMMARERQHRVSSFRAEVNRELKQLNIEVVTPIDTFHMSGRLVSASNGIYRYTGEARCDHNAIRGELTLTKGKSADLKVFYNENDYLQMVAKSGPEQLMVDVFRMVSGEKVQEVLFLLQKDAERIVSGRTYWRPAMYREIRAATESNTIARQHTANWRRFVDEVSDEYTNKAEYMRRNARPFYRALVSMKKNAISTYQDMREEISNMYHGNEFHMKDICHWFQNAKDWTRSAYERLRQSAADNYTKAKAVASRSRRSVDDITDQAWSYTQNVATRLSDWWDSLNWDDVTEKLKQNTRDIVDRVSNHPTVKDILANLRDTNIWRRVQGDAAATAGTAPSLFDQLLNRDDVQTGLSYIQKQVKESNVASKYFEVKKTIDGIMRDIRQNGIKALRTNVVSWLKDYLKVDKDRFTVDDGDVRFSLYVPLPLDDLRSIPKVDINLSQYLRDARNIYNNYVPKCDWSFWDYYYNYKPSSNIKDMIPPFNAHATISGNQHYMTFDRRFYEFSGECSYLLARDFIDGTFTVIVNYERTRSRPVRKSLTVMTNDKTIVIDTDGSVMMDNSRVEMPIDVSGVTILREENQIRVNNKNGVWITCDLVHNQCTVEVSGWYFSKTGGLFGTYNNEQIDDFITVDKERLQSVGQFAASWSLGARCRPTNSAIDVSNEVVPESRRYDVCAKYFVDDSSPFRRCFKVVDPKPFMKMCLNDMPTDVNRLETEEDTCNIAAFYVSECQRVEVPIRIPSLCVRCEMENGNVFSEGQNVTIRDDEVPNSADIVFVIHHSECNKMMVDNLKNVVDNLEKVFKAEQLTNNRYAILGYGGPGIDSDVHVHTMNGQVFATRDKILLGLENFRTTAGDKEDAMAAVKYATNLPFRVGVSKNILLLPCAPCKQGQATFSELQQLLLFRDINFHVLMQYNFLFKGNKNVGTAYIFGVDRETVYTRKDAGTTELVGDSEIRSQILMPKDLCVALSEETDGAVFNTLQYINSRPFVQKRFMDVLVRVIADKAEPSDCQICDCKPDTIGAGKADCRHCVRPNPIYDIMPNFDNILLPPPAFETPEINKPKAKTPKSPKKSKKTKVKKSKKELNAKKRAMRERRLRRLEQQDRS